MLVSDKSGNLASSVKQSGKDPTFVDFNLSPTLDDEFEIFGGRMSVPGGSSPFIKDEDHDEWFNQPINNNNRNHSMHSNPGYGHMPHGSINPSELSVSGNFGGFHQGNPADFHMAGSAIADDELLDLDLNDQAHHRNSIQSQDFYNQGQAIPQHNQASNNFFNTNTPIGEPIQSPFLHGGFNYGHQQQPFSSHVSPGMRPSNGQDYGFASARTRTSLPHMMDRKPSDQRSPMTPKTPGMAALHLSGTPESGGMPSQPINTLSHRHQKSMSAQWDTTPGLSYVETPAGSPTTHMGHPQISEVLKSGKSLPNKIESHHANPAFQSQEAKRRRRRESHNMVERRRRDNINERIQELSHLVPQHRLEDEKVRKHLATNGPSPLSPTLPATSLGSAPATSLLSSGRRAAAGAGNITMGIPMEDKDKGPNKGDILNGSVGWTRDLMWCLNTKLQQEAQLKDYITQLGGSWPFQESEDEKRMYTELIETMDKNDVETFAYSRSHGSGLRVPKHTNLAGEPVDSNGNSSPSSVSPGAQLPSAASNNPFSWSGNPTPFKEEDEYNMQL